jgi:translation initiation factor eIF-2B subunit epsilon
MNLEEEEPVAAVVVCDSFNQRFRPLTLDKPRCLLPLVNIPLLEYTLECLAVSNIKDIYIICCAHSEQIKDYIKKSRWAKSSTNIQIIVNSELLSVGDAIRDMVS